MTVTTVINAQTLAALSPSELSNINLYTFLSTATAFAIELSITGGTSPSPSKIVLRYAPVATQPTADAAGVKLVYPSSFTLEGDARLPIQRRFFTTDVYPCRGRYLLLWLEVPNLTADATVTVKVIEF